MIISSRGEFGYFVYLCFHIVLISLVKIWQLNLIYMIILNYY